MKRKKKQTKYSNHIQEYEGRNSLTYLEDLYILIRDVAANHYNNNHDYEYNSDYECDDT